MPYERPGERYYATATKTTLHGAACVENGVVGVAIKQVAPAAGTGLTDVANTTIAIGEKFVIDTKGIVEVPVGALTPTKGMAVYLTAATNALTPTGPASGTTTYKFGTVVEVAGERGTPTGRVRINLDLKDSFV